MNPVRRSSVSGAELAVFPANCIFQHSNTGKISLPHGTIYNAIMYFL